MPVILDPVIRKTVIAAARANRMEPDATDEQRNHYAMLMVCFMAGALSGDVELANALRGVVGLPEVPELQERTGGFHEVTPLGVVEVDIDAIHRKAAA